MRSTYRAAAMVLSAAVVSVACSSGSSGDAAPALRCPVSTAKSGGLCQVNFFCDGGDGPAAYCSSDGSCACGAAAENPKTFTSADMCKQDMATMAAIANRECAFGM